MKVLVVGSGGREHAIIKKIKENKKITQIFALPGNGGIANDAVCIDIGAKEIDKIVDFCSERKNRLRCRRAGRSACSGMCRRS